MKRLVKLYRKMALPLFYLWRDLAWRLGFYRSLVKNAKAARIIIYHGICEKDPHRFNSLFVTKQRFEQHLAFYKKYFNVVSVDAFCRKEFDPGKVNICLTFDDGFANNLHLALPLLEKYNLPACFFVTAIRGEGSNILWNDFLAIASATGPHRLELNGEVFVKNKHRTYYSSQTGRSLSDTLRDTGFAAKQEMMQLLEPALSIPTLEANKGYWLQMTTEEIRRLSASTLVTVGSHGYYHNDLGRIDSEAIANELRGSKSFLESVIQQPVTKLAYPYGTYRADTLTASVEAGYTQLFVTELANHIDHAPFCVQERMGVNPYVSTRNQMIAIIKGTYA